MIKNNLKIIFFGTPEFGKIILAKLIESGYKPRLVVTAPDKPVGRKQELTPSPVKILAEKNKIPVAQPE
jgi:methionyl-tRNA formyltransferase